MWEKAEADFFAFMILVIVITLGKLTLLTSIYVEMQ